MKKKRTQYLNVFFFSFGGFDLAFTVTATAEILDFLMLNERARALDRSHQERLGVHCGF